MYSHFFKYFFSGILFIGNERATFIEGVWDWGVWFHCIPFYISNTHGSWDVQFSTQNSSLRSECSCLTLNTVDKLYLHNEDVFT